MEILTGEQMRAADRHAIEALGIPSLELMEAAGAGIAGELLRCDPDLRQKTVTVVCGKGNNGGDGLVIARHLAVAGVPVRAIVLAEPEALSPDAAVNLERARGESLDLECAADAIDWERCLKRIPAGALVVDALLGTGIRGAVRGLTGRVIEDYVTGRSQGFGFVEMGCDTEAQAAIQGLNGSKLDGRSLTVSEARPREERPQRDGDRGRPADRRWRY